MQFNNLVCQILHGDGIHQMILSMNHQQGNITFTPVYLLLDQRGLVLMRFVQFLYSLYQLLSRFRKSSLFSCSDRLHGKTSAVSSVHDDLKGYFLHVFDGYLPLTAP